MAEIDFDASYGEDSSAFGGNIESLINWLGGLLSLALIAGLCWWGYQLVMRDVSGIPVVRALEGPMRVAPENPGGRLADHQGLAVNAIAAEGEAEAPAERLVLAPRAVELSSEDVAGSDLAVLLPEAEATSSAASDEMLLSEAEPAGLAADVMAADSEETAVPDRASIIQATLLEVNESIDALEAAENDLVPAGTSGLATSLVPTLRPASLSGAATPLAMTSNASATMSDGLSLDPASLPPGTRLAQLGAFASEEIALQEWDRLSQKFELYMSGKQRVIERAESGGNVFYRLRAYGFDEVGDARRFCSALVAAQSNCIPVVTR